MSEKPKSFKPKTGIGSARKFNGSAHIDAMYDEKWNKYRAKFLAENPRCYSCGTKATVVDHLHTHKGDYQLFIKRDNHIPLCAKCHNTITGLFDRGPVQRLTEKLLWIARNRSRNELSFKVKVLPSYP